MPRRPQGNESAPDVEAAAEALAPAAEGASMFEGFRPLSEKQVDEALPLVEAMVVYLGSDRKKSVTLVGTMHRERFGDAVVLTPILEGTEVYDFGAIDATGKAIVSRLVPSNMPEQYRGRPFLKIRHPAHLATLFKMKDRNGNREFEVMPSKATEEAFMAYLKRHERALRVQEQQLEETLKDQ